ncbi:MAG TPA: YdeI/OmpD-associated family protein [Opitutaceae bacterium]|nr:YdeI/OmpD-associated family protein [Opitutaceae bacterium]
MKPTFFASAADFRRWLNRNHAKQAERWIGFYKKDSGRGGLTYAEAVDEALCFGWIDGRVRRIDETSHMQRYTPRRPGSIWSNINVEKVRRLTAAGRMQPAGIAAFAARTAAKTGIYSFERKQPATLPADFAKRFRANKKAWAFFSAQPPGYRRLAVHKIVSGKQPATRERWLARIIAACAAGKRW